MKEPMKTSDAAKELSDRYLSGEHLILRDIQRTADRYGVDYDDLKENLDRRIERDLYGNKCKYCGETRVVTGRAEPYCPEGCPDTGWRF